MKGVFSQRGDVWRYVVVKGVHNAIPFIAVIAALSWGAWSAIAILGTQILLGMFTDLSFFHALRSEVRNGPER